MTVRSDLTVNWDVSPRIITVASPATEITIQDLHDTCRSLEAEPTAMDNKPLIQSSGLEALGGGTSVGLTSTLQNALVAFEARLGAEYIQCNVSGGNLVAVDDLGAYLTTPISPTAFTQIVVTASSSATSQNQAAIEYASFGDQVTLDATNGTALNGASPLGSLIGNKESPVNNAVDARLIADTRGLDKIYVRGDYTFETGDNVSNLTVEGVNPTQSTIVCNAGANTLNTEFFECHLQGTLDGGATVRECLLTNLIYVNGYIHNSIISSGTIYLDGGADAYFIDCKSGVAGASTPVLDLGGAGQALVIRDYTGGLKITNKTGTDNISIDILSGHIIVDSTISTGDIIVRGIAKLTDNASGTARVNSADLLVPSRITNLQYLVENLRESHSGTGDVYYWNPYDGFDTNEGKSKEQALKTFPAVMAKVTDYNHDVIIAVAGNPASSTIYTDPIVINKNWVSLRAPGIDFIVKPTTTSSNNALVDCNGTTGVSITGLVIDGTNVVGTGLLLNSAEAYLSDINIQNITGVGLYTEHCFTTKIERMQVLGCTTHGIKIHNCRGLKMNYIDIKDTAIGFESTASLLGTGGQTELRNVTFVDLTTGISIGTNVVSTRVHSDCIFTASVNTNIVDNGIETYISDPASDVWTSTAGALVANNISYIKDIEGGKWELVGNQMIFYASDNITEISRFNMFDSSGNPTTTGDIYKRERV